MRLLVPFLFIVLLGGRFVLSTISFFDDDEQDSLAVEGSPGTEEVNGQWREDIFSDDLGTTEKDEYRFAGSEVEDETETAERRMAQPVAAGIPVGMPGRR